MPSLHKTNVEQYLELGSGHLSPRVKSQGQKHDVQSRTRLKVPETYSKHMAPRSVCFVRLKILYSSKDKIFLQRINLKSIKLTLLYGEAVWKYTLFSSWAVLQSELKMSKSTGGRLLTRPEPKTSQGKDGPRILKQNVPQDLSMVLISHETVGT